MRSASCGVTELRHVLVLEGYLTKDQKAPRDLYIIKRKFKPRILALHINVRVENCVKKVPSSVEYEVTSILEQMT